MTGQSIAERINFEAERFRAAILSIPVEARPITMRCFPRGACGDTSLLFGAAMVDLGIAGFVYVSASRGSVPENTWTSHAWLQRGELVVDLTAAQFADAPSAIIVASPSAWHQAFDVERTSPSDFRQWSGWGADMLHPMYRRIQALLIP